MITTPQTLDGMDALASALSHASGTAERYDAAAALAGAAIDRNRWDRVSRLAFAIAGDMFESLSMESDAPPGCAIDAILCLQAGIAENVDARVETLLGRLDRPAPHRSTVDNWVTDALRGRWDDLGQNHPRLTEYLPGSFPPAIAKDLAFAIYDQAFALTHRVDNDQQIEPHAATPSWRAVEAALRPYAHTWQARRVRLLFQVLLVDPRDDAEGGALDLLLARRGWTLRLAEHGWIAELPALDLTITGHPWADRAATVLRVAREYAPAAVWFIANGWRVRQAKFDHWVAEHTTYGVSLEDGMPMRYCWSFARSMQQNYRPGRRKARR